MTKKIRLKDIATELGVSIGTVSVVLNGKGDNIRISKDLSDRINMLAKTLGYTPNQIAISLRTGETKLMCLIVEDFANPFFATITSLIEKKLKENGYQLLCSSVTSDPLNTTKLIRKLANGMVDGFFITPMPGLEKDIQMLVKHGMPLVLLDSNFPQLKISHVLINNTQGVTLGMDHLLTNGYKKIMFVSVKYDMIQIRMREDAYKTTMRQEKLKTFIVRINYQDDKKASINKLKNAIKQFKPEAIFFATNYLGIIGLECLTQLKITIPDQIGVVCFDDHELFQLYDPPLTVIQQPIEAIVNNAVSIMFSKLKTHRFNVMDSILLPAEIIVRHSTLKKSMKKIC